MQLLDTVVPIIGVTLCAIAFLQCALWSAHSLSNLTTDRRRFNQRRGDLQRDLGKDRRAARGVDHRWSGYRNFRVDRLQKETPNCTSVYLVPEDGKPIPGFQPGQHLTLRFRIPGQNKPVVRCYSLSDAPGKPYYRITVKRITPSRDRPELRPGKLSEFVNGNLRIGDQIEVKSPTGSFFLRQSSNKPIVMLAGGIGITPMISMINHLVQNQPDRLVVLAYGVHGGGDHAFKEILDQVSNANPNINLITCYSQAAATDKLGADYHFEGFVSVDLLRKVLPDNNCEFYLCGPPAFMESLYKGLVSWSVAESDIQFEAFGPASIQPAKQESTDTSAATQPQTTVTFANSDTSAVWDGSCDSILELAEANQIEIDSGCQAGSCGTCQTELISGSVTYPEGLQVDCEPGHCLVCIARPDGPTELGA